MTTYPASSGPDVNVVATSVTTPTDRVRWPSIFAGLFAALSTLVVLAVLGAAVAGSAWDPGDSARSFGIGAGIWAAISALLAFFVGGFLASRTAAVRGHNNGLLNGAMVWVVAIPLLLYMIIGPLLRATGGAISTAAQSASNVARDTLRDDTARSADRSRADDRPEADRIADDRARTASAQVQATTQRVTQAVNDPRNQEKAANATAKSAWGSLVSLLLGLAAAAAGGYFGSRDRLFAAGNDRYSDRQRGPDRDWRHEDDRNRPSAAGPTIVTPSGPTTTDRP
jgi:hypothetical protein